MTQEQMERVWQGCDKCKSHCYTCIQNETARCRKCKNGDGYIPMHRYCPHCSRPLTPEAWAELRKRWEELCGKENP